MATERGLFQGTPYNGDWSTIGIYLGQHNASGIWDSMASAAIKVPLGRVQHFGPADDGAVVFFPYAQFVAYNNQQVAAGKPSLFVSATYNGVKYPVYFYLQLGLNAQNQPTAPTSNWRRAVNVGDDRFITWWLDNYVQPIMMANPLPNQWLGLDNCMYRYDNYGIVDSSNVFHYNVTWDSPYAQSNAGFMSSLEYFFQRVKQLDPSLHLLCNEGTMEDYSQFQPIYSNLDGLAEEDMTYYYIDGSAYRRLEMYQKFENDTWMGDQGKVTLFKWMSLTNDSTLPDQLRRAYIHYLMVRGANSFFDPQFNTQEVPPSNYSAMAQALGTPVAATTVVHTSSTYPGYILYSRPTQNGIAYLNWTGTTQTITLPAGHSYVNRYGQPVTQLTIPDMQGDYAVYSTATSATATPIRTATTVPSATPIRTNTPTASQNILGAQTPAELHSCDCELGVRFQSTIAGHITGLRYYRTPSETGSHIGHLWSASGASLGSVTFSNESGSGWQSALFATPIAIAANTTYVASVNSNVAYGATANSLLTSIRNGSLLTVADGRNGVYNLYKYGFPSVGSSEAGENYFRDVLFTAS